MPLFDLMCPKCNGYFEDVLIPVDAERLCPDCGVPAVSKGVLINTAGIIFSNAETNTQLGVTFESNAQKRAFLRSKDPKEELREYVKGSSDERALSDRIRIKAEMAARKQGYTDLEDRNRRVKAEYNRGWRPRGGNR